MLPSDGAVRGAGRAEAGRVGHNFQIYVQMFLSCARTGCGARVPRGEDAYRKVSRRIEKCSRGFFARAMMERAGWISHCEKAALSHPRDDEGAVGNGRRERERKDHRDRGTRLFLDTGVAVSFSDAP